MAMRSIVGSLAWPYFSSRSLVLSRRLLQSASWYLRRRQQSTLESSRRLFSSIVSEDGASSLVPPSHNGDTSIIDPRRSRMRRNKDEPKTLKDPPGIDLNKFGIYEITGTEGTGSKGDGYRAILGVHGPQETWDGDGAGVETAQGGVFAGIMTSGNQFKVSPGDILYTNRIPGEVNTQYVFDKVVMLGTLKWSIVGRPFIPDVRVVATIEEQTRSRKTYTIKFKKRKGYRRKLGHRQPITRFRIDDVDYTPPQDPTRYVEHVIRYDPTAPLPPNIMPCF